MSDNRILIIEDTKTMAELYAKYLNMAGYEVDTAEDGRKGMRMLEQQHYAVVVLDLNLPDMNGIEILEATQRANPLLPIIVVTAYGSLGSAVDAMKHGAFDFIMKPFASARLNTTVKLAIDHANLRRELKTLKENMFENIKKLGNSETPVLV